MKKITSLLFTTLFSIIAYSQQFPLQSQYQFNYSMINPAVVVENDFTSIRASFRQQWVGFSEKPIATQLLSLNKGYGTNGLGFTVFSDETGGAFSKSGLSVSYAHKVKFSINGIPDESELYLGISAGAAKVNISNLGDPSIINSEDIVPEVTFGGYYKINDFKLGVSIPGLLNANMELTEATGNTIFSHVYTMLSYKYEINENLSLHPSFLVKTTESNNQVDANLNVKFQNKLWFGASYRQDFGPALFVGIDFGRLLSIYSHDISTNEMSSYSNGSHEFTIGYDFIPENELDKKNDSAEKILDRDKDGIEDKIDLCPNEYGIEIANGCPDFDKDGIPDEYDLCPHLYGNSKFQGCPDLTIDEQKIITDALADLTFSFDKDNIDYASYGTLTKLVVLMHSNPSMFLLIEGFASSEGTEAYNLSLSARRAKSVQGFFLERGIFKNRLVMDFYGEESPLNSNFTEQERAKNRRVEFDIRYHLYDNNTAADIKNKYDNLVANFYGNNSSLTPKKPIVVVQKDVQIESDEKDVMLDLELVEGSIEEDVAIEEVFIEESIEKDVLIEEAESNTNIYGDINKYLVVVQVFSDISNAKNYISNNDEDLSYMLIGGKFYVYIYSSLSREECNTFSNLYEGSCWIKNP